MTHYIIETDWFTYNAIHILKPKDLFNFKYVSKTLYNLITTKDIYNSIISTIHEMLKKQIKLNYNDILQFLSTHNITISGSFIIQCALDEYCPTSDIDMITCHSIHESILSDYFQKQMERYDAVSMFPVVDYLVGEQCIQLIHTDLPDAISHIANFDLNICKNGYTYATNELYIQNLNHIMNKRMVIDKNNYNLVSRCEKYIKRGFKLEQSPCIQNLLDSIDDDHRHLSYVKANNNPISHIDAIIFQKKLFHFHDIFKILARDKGNIFCKSGTTYHLRDVLTKLIANEIETCDCDCCFKGINGHKCISISVSFNLDTWKINLMVHEHVGPIGLLPLYDSKVCTYNKSMNIVSQMFD